MADTPGISVREIVAFGQKVANLFQTWSSLARRGKNETYEILHIINATANALHQIQDSVDGDGSAVYGQPVVKILTQAGHEEVEALAIKCDLLYKTTMLLIQKAADRETEKEPSLKRDHNAETLQAELLTGPVLDPTSLKALKLAPKCRDQDSWLEPRFERCQEQLRWIHMRLIAILHMVKLARLQFTYVFLSCIPPGCAPADVFTSSGEREAGAFEQELWGRAFIQLSRKKEVYYTKKKAKKQEEAQRQWELRKKGDDTDASSVSSSASSQKSNSTSSTAVVDQEASKENDLIVKQDTEQVSLGKPTDEVASKAMEDEKSFIPDQQKSTIEEITQDKEPGDSFVERPAKSPSSNFGVQLKLKLPARISDLMHRIFGKDDQFKQDWESDDLEAHIFQMSFAHGPVQRPIKVPFGHRRLHYGLDRVLDKHGSTWNRYIDSGPRMQWIIDGVVHAANRLQNRERACIAFQEYKKGTNEHFALVFLSIREEKKPILFEDAVGRTYTIPFETCRTWEGMRETIMEAFNDVAVIGPHVLEGHYDILSCNGDTILPGLWSSTIKPGDTVSMTMRRPIPPLRRYHGPPPFCLDTRDSKSGWLKGQHWAHIEKLRLQQRQRQACSMRRGLAGPPVPPDPLRSPGMGIPPPMPPGPLRPPGMGIPLPMPPPPDCRIYPGKTNKKSRPRSPSVSTVSTVDEDAITEEEDKQLRFVDFVAELEKTKSVTISDLLTTFTSLKDGPGEDLLAGLLSDDSDYESDSSGSSSSICSSN
ncbi:hypothetical protein VM1G_05433 [Cytospora mali]|uniref:Ubiquitin-like domain-containing protein n=1 Tax=Cytospora mali TaxID=578113 RepID=A0A194VYQ8_CYTMA|nr:hypothetical protein VM1G_05433 [Valsa mali]